MIDSVYSDGTPSADEIHRDIAAIRAFGTKNPGVLVDLKLSHEPTTHLVVLLKAGTNDSIAALKARLAHGENLEVEFTSVTSEQLETVRMEIEGLITERGPQGFRGYDVQWGQVHITLRPDQLELAGELFQRYGNLVQLEVGRKPYPPPPVIARVEQSHRSGPTMPEITIPELEVTLILDHPTITRGSDGRGLVRFKNVGEEPITIWTDLPLTPRLTDPVSNETVGYFDGWIGGVGKILQLGPGDVEAMPVIFGTTSPPDVEGYSAPPGWYLVECVVPVYGEPGENGVPTVSILRVGTEDIEVTEPSSSDGLEISLTSRPTLPSASLEGDVTLRG